MFQRRWLGLTCGLLASAPAFADPGYYLVVPYATPGQLALDLRYWTVDSAHRDAVLWPEAGLRYGVNSRWATELLVSFIGPTLHEQRVSSWNWQNDWLLTQLIHEPGEGNMLEYGLVWQTELGSSTQLNANLFFESTLSHGGEGTEAKYQWQVLQRLQRGLRVGVQGFGELGRVGHPEDKASHRAGPVLHLGLSEKVDLQGAYLWGKVYGRQAEMFSAQMLVSF